MRALRLWTLHKLGYKIRDLYDARNDPNKLEEMIAVESIMNQVTKEEQRKIIESMFKR